MKVRLSLMIACSVVALLLPGLVIAGAKSSAQEEQAFTVRGDVEHPLRLTRQDLAAMPRRTVMAKDRDGQEARFEGVLVGEILNRAGAKLGDRLRGDAHAAYLLVQAADGYRVVFALPELDDAYTDRLVLLADTRDGKPLADPEGPFRVIVPGEKKHARWIRQVRRLVVRRVDADPESATLPSTKREAKP
jgi:DMSO/TMAO reductase YedYZ molybdopterin-dependent catalytic subunit